MSTQTSFTLPVLGGTKPVYRDIRTSHYNFRKKYVELVDKSPGNVSCDQSIASEFMMIRLV